MRSVMHTTGPRYHDHNRFSQPHPWPGRLLVIDGIDGSGKSSQVELLAAWLESRQIPTLCTHWSSARLVRDLARSAKRAGLLTPTTFALLHASDFAHRQAYDIIPALKAGLVVLADRYVYTALARDVSRGVDRQWARKVYRFAVQPDRVIYLRASVDLVLSRLMAGRLPIKAYEAGVDLNISNDRVESFRVFQSRLLREFAKMADEYDFVTLDAGLPMAELQQQIRGLAGELVGLAERDVQADSGAGGV